MTTPKPVRVIEWKGLHWKDTNQFGEIRYSLGQQTKQSIS